MITPKVQSGEDMRAAIGDFHYSQTKYLVQGPSQRENFLGDVATYRKASAAAHAATSDARRPGSACHDRREVQGLHGGRQPHVGRGAGRHHRAAVAQVDPSNDAADGLVEAADGYIAEVKGEQAAAVRAFASSRSTSQTAHGCGRPDRPPRSRGIAWTLTRRLSGGLAPIRERLSSLRDHCLAGIENGLGAMASEGDLTVDVVPVTTPVVVDGSDEVAELGRTFNDMLAKTRPASRRTTPCGPARPRWRAWPARSAVGDLSSSVEVLSDRDQFGLRSSTCRPI